MHCWLCILFSDVSLFQSHQFWNCNDIYIICSVCLFFYRLEITSLAWGCRDSFIAIISCMPSFMICGHKNCHWSIIKSIIIIVHGPDHRLHNNYTVPLWQAKNTTWSPHSVYWWVSPGYSQPQHDWPQLQPKLNCPVGLRLVNGRPRSWSGRVYMSTTIPINRKVEVTPANAFS